MLVKVWYLFKYLSWTKAKIYVVFLNLEFTSFVRENVSCYPDSPCPREFFTINLYCYFSFNDLALLFYLASSKPGFLLVSCMLLLLRWSGCWWYYLIQISSNFFLNLTFHPVSGTCIHSVWKVMAKAQDCGLTLLDQWLNQPVTGWGWIISLGFPWCSHGCEGDNLLQV